MKFRIVHRPLKRQPTLTVMGAMVGGLAAGWPGAIALGFIGRLLDREYDDR